MKTNGIIISGPSGSGKSTLIKNILQKFSCCKLAVSYTTRKKRLGEFEGLDYHFVTIEQFYNMQNADFFLEYVECYGNKYGTPKKELYNINKLLIFDLDFQGAKKILEMQELHIVGILILPPSLRAAEERLFARKSETKESVAKRLSDFCKTTCVGKYDHIIINKDIKKAFQEISKIITNII